MLPSDYLAEWSFSERDQQLYDLAMQYHTETETYDRTVCTGPIEHGSIRPMTPRELGLINQNARKVYQRIVEAALAMGFTREEITREIGRRA